MNGWDFDVRPEEVVFPVKPSGEVYYEKLYGGSSYDVYMGITLLGAVDRVKPGKWNYYTTNGVTKTLKAGVERLTELYV